MGHRASLTRFAYRVRPRWYSRVLKQLYSKVTVGRCPWQILSCVVEMWRTHRGGSVPRVFTERSEGPVVTLNLCVMRRYYLGEGDLVST